MLPTLLERRAEEAPDRVFIRQVDGHDVTYGELDGSVRRWASALTRLGLKEKDVVACMLPPSATSAAIWLACSWIRAYELPVNTSYRGNMLRHILRDSKVRIAVIHAKYYSHLAEVSADIPNLDKVIVVSDPGTDPPPEMSVNLLHAESLLESAGTYRPSRATPSYRDVSSIVYTSGTTGASKGVLVPWGQLATQPWLYPLDRLREGGSRYSPFPLYHVSGKSSIYMQAVIDQPVVIRESFSTSHFWSDVRKYECVSTTLIGAMAAFLHSQPPSANDHDNPLQVVMMLPVINDVHSFEERFGVDVITCYGMTEIGWPISGRATESTSLCGRTRPGYQLRIVDDSDEPVGIGQVGELVVRSDWPWTMMQGYLGRPEETLKAWRNGWFHTGDAFKSDGRSYYFVDRIKDAIRRRGENISSREVEASILQHPDVLEVAVIGVPSDYGEEEVLAIVVLRPNSETGPPELSEFLQPRMPRFMLPRYIAIVNSLPKTDTRKVNKPDLRDRDWSHVWDRES